MRNDMKTNKIIIITAVAISLCFIGYIWASQAGHEEHNHAEHLDTDDIAEEHDSHDVHETDEDYESQESAIELTDEQVEEIGLETAIAGSGVIDIKISLPGEIKINQDRLTYIVPRVQGIVTDVRKNLGDVVKAGETIAVIESRELADAQAEYMSAVERYEIAKISFEREEKLWNDKVSSEQDYFDIKQDLAQASIEKNVARQKLLALGFDTSYLQKLFEQQGSQLTRFELKVPFDGTVIEKNIVLGEIAGPEKQVYTVADLNWVWVDLQVYPTDIQKIKQGQEVVISADIESPQATGEISYLGPTVQTESRTVLARVLLSNKSKIFRPGLFVTGKAVVSEVQSEVVVSKEAVQTLEGKKCVFIKDEHGYEPSFVQIGLENKSQVEILSGLDAGQEYVTQGAFALKSKIITSTLDSHAGHGH